MRTIALLCPLALVSAAAARQDLRDSPEVAIISTELVTRTVRLRGIDAQGVTVVPALTTGADERVAWSEIAMILASAPLIAQRPETVRAGLADGRRLVGSIEDDASPDHLTLRDALLGSMRVPLDDIRWVGVGAAYPEDAFGDTDSVALANGDRLTGFIESIGADVAITERGGSQATRVPLERVGVVTLANPARAAAPPMVWLRSGAVVSVESFEEAPAGAFAARCRVMDGESRPVRAALTDLAAAVFPGVNLVPIASLPPLSAAPAPGRRWTRPPEIAATAETPFGLGDVLLPGPMTVSWALPETADRIAMMLLLPFESREWGDCTVTVAVDSNVLLAARLTSAAPMAELNAPLDGAGAARTLRISIDAGERGPVQDRVTIRTGVVRVR